MSLSEAVARAPDLILAWGNRSRGDDAVGPLLLDAVQARLVELGPEASRPDLIEEFQLQPENVMDLVGRRRVLFVDASAPGSLGDAPYDLTPLQPGPMGVSYTTHQMAPSALLSVLMQMYGPQVPECAVLAIRTRQFELGTDPDPQTRCDLDLAIHRAMAWVRAAGHT
jgi:hydrogenase maturation protease